jgi:phosphatidylglycerophosphatase A
MPSPTARHNQNSESADGPEQGGASVSLLTRLIATGFFSGYSPVAPGTAGSVLAVAAYALPGAESIWILSGMIIAGLIIGTRVSAEMERVLGHDPPPVTIDEIVGMWISLLALPKTLPLATAAFFVFRFFDIVKPYPARNLDRMHGGLGIMLDDVVAGVYTNVVLQLALAAGLFSWSVT